MIKKITSTERGLYFKCAPSKALPAILVLLCHVGLAHVRMV
jgi:hypothetical protein